MASRTTAPAAIVSDGLDTRSIYYRRATISRSQGASALPFDDASVVHPPSAFGTFRVLHQVGSGVLGPVFRAYDSQLDQLVAVKAFRLDLVPEHGAALAAELANVVARPVNDGAVVRPVASGLVGELPFLAQEYVAGEGLDVLLRRAGAISLRRALVTLRTVGRAIDEAWDVGVGHGALHPRDVFLAGDDDTRITGFGIAQSLERAGIRAPLRRPYASPERVAGTAWDRRADIYSLAAMVHELLTAAAAEVSAGVAAAVDKGMAESPADRFDTAKALAEAVEAELSAQADAIEAGRALSARPVVLLDEAPQQDPVSSAPLHFALEVADDGRAPATVWTTESPRALELSEPVAQSPAFPWMAAAAVGLAGAALGVVLGYQIGFSRATSTEISRIAATAAASTPETPAQQVAAAPTPAPESPTVSPQPSPASEPVRVPAAVAAAGALQVDSRPRGARVSVDGRRMGATPLRVGALSPGDHRVLIELNGHRRIVSTVKVNAGEQARLAVSLEQTDFARSVPRNR